MKEFYFKSNDGRNYLFIVADKYATPRNYTLSTKEEYENFLEKNLFEAEKKGFVPMEFKPILQKLKDKQALKDK